MAQPDIHITDFYHDTGRILISLFRSFPRGNTLWVDDICGPDELDEFGQHSQRHQACLATAVWLQRELYLTYSTQDAMAGFNHCVLTEKGFALLSGWHRKSRTRPIDELDDALLSGSSQRMEAAVQLLLQASAGRYYVPERGGPGQA
ncbi:MAG: hypothetical protein WEB07_03320 [Natronospirillum sp.]